VVRELRTVQDDQSCEICGRTILRGERPETYLAPGGMRHLVCELCTLRAEHEGWIRESAAADMPTALRRPEPRRSLIGRLRRRRENGAGPGAPDDDELEEYDFEPDTGEEALRPPPRADRERPRRRKDPRHVRAVPTNAEVKVERALELFNASEHPRKIAGIARSLGAPWVTAVPASGSPSEVTIVVAWELSWYRYRVDLGDADEPVALLDKGLELAEIDAGLRVWNGVADDHGRLAAGAPATE
jgi:hypothetical protein